MQYLVRHADSGTYYAAKKCGRYLRRKSLGTASETIAKAKLSEALDELQRRWGGRLDGDQVLTFGGCARLYRQRVEADGTLKPHSLRYRLSTFYMLGRTWPGYEAVHMLKLQPAEVAAWWANAQKLYSAGRCNSLLDTVRAVFQIAVDNGTMSANLANNLSKIRVVSKPPELPGTADFNAELDRMEKDAHTRISALQARFLTYSGLRIGHANLLLVENIALKEGYISIPPFKHVKEWRRIPILPDMIPVLQKLTKDRHPKEKLLPYASIRKALKTIGNRLGVRLTHHVLRHLFATRCLECGVDIKTTSEWLTQQDGGKMLMRVYSHLRDEHSKKMAEKVSFG